MADLAIDDTIDVNITNDAGDKKVTVTIDGVIGRLDVSPSDTVLDITKGNTPGSITFRGMGERESTGTTTQGEDMWRGNELSSTPAALASHTTIPTPASAGEQMTIISENANDTSAGTGARTMDIEYLDATGNTQHETVTMNGTTAVNTVATNIRFVNNFHVQTVGSNGVAEGHIRIYKTGDATLVYNMIHSGGNQSLVPHKMVPLGKQLHLKEWHCSEGNNKRLVIRLRADCDDHIPSVIHPGVFLFKSTAYLNQSASGQIALGYVIPALSIVKVSVWGVVTNAECACHWWGILVDD
jgi:hypothetical protein